MLRFYYSANQFYCVFMITLCFCFEAFARAGGGGAGGGGFGGRGRNDWYVAVIAAIVGGIGSFYVNQKIKSRQKYVENALKIMSHREPEWTKLNLMATARESFVKLQAAWGAQDLNTLQVYLHPTLFSQWAAEIKLLQTSGLANNLTAISINNTRIVDIQNFADDEKDEFTVCFDACGIDNYFKNGEILNSKKTTFREFWTFEYQIDKWVLREITQAKGWRKFISRHLTIERSNKIKNKSKTTSKSA